MSRSRPIPIRKKQVQSPPRVPNMAISLGDYSGRGDVMSSPQVTSHLIDTLTEKPKRGYRGYLKRRSNDPVHAVSHIHPPLIPESQLAEDSLLPDPSVYQTRHQRDPLLLSPPPERPDVGASFVESLFGVDLSLLPPDEDIPPPKDNASFLSPRIDTNETMPQLPSGAMSGLSSVMMSATRNTNLSADHVDPKDGHKWRSNYCVLEGDGLFFYKDMAEADHPEAVAERLQNRHEMDSPSSHSITYSPMPHHANVHRWEKCVSLECVDSVRLAFQEHGPHSFELVAGNEKLVLRAPNDMEMKNWRLELHCSIGDLFFSNLDRGSHSFSERPRSPRKRQPTKSRHSVASLSPRYFKPAHRGGGGGGVDHIQPIPDLSAMTSAPPLVVTPDSAPEVVDGDTTPETERPIPPSTKAKYIPPHLRNNRKPAPVVLPREPQDEDFMQLKLGGCADPSRGSILEDRYKRRKSSRLGKLRTKPFGYQTQGNLRYEIGAYSECGIRDHNEDSFLVTSDLLAAFDRSEGTPLGDSSWNILTDVHRPGLFAIFDGHSGDEAARYAAERLTRYLYEASIGQVAVEDVLASAIQRLDNDFCELCRESSRQWESGTTALVAALVDEELVVANLGDARGIMGRTVTIHDVNLHEENGWNALSSDGYNDGMQQLWKEVTHAHSPARVDERRRIESANGWVTTEESMPVSRLKRIDFSDNDVHDILESYRHDTTKASSAPHRYIQISRVCGDLAVSRALGDSGYKTTQDGHWEFPDCFFAFPDGHSRQFVGNLVSNEPEFHCVKVSQKGSTEEFLLLACDGFWDVIDADDAYRITRGLLFDKDGSVKDVVGRLAELAVHLGSSDNITIIVVKFSER